MSSRTTQYANGWAGIPADFTEAVRFLRIAANGGSLPAKVSLAVMKREGLGVDPDPEEAMDELRQCVAAGSVNAAFHIGVSFEKGLGAEQDTKKAHECYVEASKKGDGLSTRRLY